MAATATGRWSSATCASLGGWASESTPSPSSSASPRSAQHRLLPGPPRRGCRGTSSTTSTAGSASACSPTAACSRHDGLRRQGRLPPGDRQLADHRGRRRDADRRARPTARGGEMNQKDSPEALEGAIARYNDAWNAHDLDAIMAMHAPDMVFENHTAHERAEGEAVARAYRLDLRDLARHPLRGAPHLLPRGPRRPRVDRNRHPRERLDESHRGRGRRLPARAHGGAPDQARMRLVPPADGSRWASRWRTTTRSAAGGPWTASSRSIPPGS